MLDEKVPGRRLEGMAHKWNHTGACALFIEGACAFMYYMTDLKWPQFHHLSITIWNLFPVFPKITVDFIIWKEVTCYHRTVLYSTAFRLCP